MDNKRQQTLSRLDEVIETLETLDISFLTGADKANAEYAINEAVIDIQEIEGLVEEEAEEEVLVFES
jgi:NAD kinase